MIDFRNAAQHEEGIWKAVYDVLGNSRTTRDGQYSHSSKDVEKVQSLLYNEVVHRHLASGIYMQTLDDCKTHTRKAVTDKLHLLTTDNIANPLIGIGTLNDPSTATVARQPLTISPYETTSIYASGGLGALIIDKKSEGLISNGVEFYADEEEFWDTEKLKQLEERAYETGFIDCLTRALRDRLIYGGALMYPIYYDDTIESFSANWRDLVEADIAGKDSIKYWAYADRWNVVFVPNYNITAEDYLNPQVVYIPISGITLDTSRSFLLRTKTLPYWAAINNMGWAPSDYEGFFRSLYAYDIMVMSVPIMAQQMSLLVYQMPIDALTANIGSAAVKKLMQSNEKTMREWSILNPKAINMVGELQTVDRSFGGFKEFMDVVINDLCATSEIPRPTLFYTDSKGFNDNTGETLLNQNEYSKLHQRRLETMLKPAVKLLVADVFGWGNNIEEMTKQLKITFDKPVIASESDTAEIGARYAAALNSMVQASIPPDISIKIIGQFFKSVEVTDEDIESVKSAAEEQKKMEQEAMQNPMQGGGNKNPSSGGWGGKAGSKAGTGGGTAVKSKTTGSTESKSKK